VRERRKMLLVAGATVVALSLAAVGLSGAAFNSSRGANGEAAAGTLNLTIGGAAQDFPLGTLSNLQPGGLSSPVVMPLQNAGTLRGLLEVSGMSDVDCTAGPEGDPTAAESAAGVVIGFGSDDAQALQAAKPVVGYRHPDGQSDVLDYGVLNPNQYLEIHVVFGFSGDKDASGNDLVDNKFQGVTCSLRIKVTLLQAPPQ